MNGEKLAINDLIGTILILGGMITVITQPTLTSASATSSNDSSGGGAKEYEGKLNVSKERSFELLEHVSEDTEDPDTEEEDKDGKI